MNNLSDKDHEQMTDFLKSVLNTHRKAEIDTEKAVANIAHVMSAIDKNNHDEARSFMSIIIKEPTS